MRLPGSTVRYKSETTDTRPSRLSDLACGTRSPSPVPGAGQLDDASAGWDRSAVRAGGWDGNKHWPLVPTPDADLRMARPPGAAAVACTKGSAQPPPRA